jgi:hypothetical protein
MVGLAIAAALGAMLAQPAPVGQFRLAASEGDEVKQAIERVVSKMSFLTRGAARERIAAKCVAYPSVNIRREGEGFRIQLEMGSNVVVREGGPAVDWKTAKGETVKIRLMPGFVQVIESGDGQRENRFVLNGDKLTLTARLTSGRLPAPIEFQLVYRRAP